MKRVFYLSLIISIALSAKIFAQKELTIEKHENEVVIDGRLDEDVWSRLKPATQFTQLEPEKGKSATQVTSVYYFYDEENIYFAFRCQLNTDVVANVQVRDALLQKSDDGVMIILDAYNDKRSAFAFGVNPLNTQLDVRINDDGSSLNVNWDAIWKSATSVSENEWIAEFAIPFKSIKYKQGKDVWGINFSRLIRSNAETVYWSGELSDDLRISQGGLLKGIIPPEVDEKVTITPYASLRYEDSDLTGQYNSYLPQVGMDITYLPVPNITLSATINPDFASVEGDREQIDLSGWEEGFPEKRLFFQEGNEMFDTRYDLFYSRRIGDLNYGTKVTGKAGDYSFNAIHASSVENEDMNLPSALFTVGRIKKDVLESSTIGATIVDKTTDSISIRSYGVDWTLNPGKYWNITGQLMGSTPGDFVENFGGFMRVAHESSKHHIHLRYSDLGENLKENINQTGFIRDDDRRELDSDISYKFWFDDGLFKYIQFFSMNNAYWDHQGNFRSSRFLQFVRFYTQSKFAFEFKFDNESRRVELDNGYNRFHNSSINAEFGYNTDESNNVELEVTKGKNFGRNYLIYEASLNVSPVRKLSLSYELASLNFNSGQPDDINLRLEESTLLNILSVNYYFTNDLWLRVLTQHDTYKERLYMYGQFGWRFKPPFGALYLIYAGDDFYNHDTNVYYKSKTVFLKLTYPLSF